MWTRKVMWRVVRVVVDFLRVYCNTGFLKAGIVIRVCRMICTLTFGPLRRSMMKMNLYSIFDTKSGVFDRPFCAVSDGAATRAFGDMCKEPESVIGKHPDDFALYRVGSWNNVDAQITVEPKECMITGPEILSQMDNVAELKRGQ